MKNRLQSIKENPNGLYRKYNISKTNGEPIDKNAEYFVLRLDDVPDDKEHIDACRQAIIEYADRIEEHSPQLANDIYYKYEEYRVIYCPKCGSCGEDGCCPSHMCSNDKKGKYCNSYFNTLQEDRNHLDTWLWFMKKYHREIYDDFYKRIEILEKEERFDGELNSNGKLNDEGDDYER